MRTSKLIYILAVGLSACNFTKDNVQSSLVLKVDGGAGGFGTQEKGGCPKFQKEMPVGELMSALDCYEKLIAQAFDKVAGQRAGTLGNRELQALLSRVVPNGQDKVEMSEIAALLLIKQAAVGGPADSVSLAEIRKLLEAYKHAFLTAGIGEGLSDSVTRIPPDFDVAHADSREVLRAFYKDNRKGVDYPDLRRGLEELLDRARATKDFAQLFLHREHLEGFFALAKRARLPGKSDFMRKNLTAANAAIVFDALGLVSGYEKDSPIPFTLFNQVVLDAEKIAFDSPGGDHGRWASIDTSPLPVAAVTLRIAAFKKQFDTSRAALKDSLGFSRGARIGRGRLEGLLGSVKDAQIYGRNGQAIRVNLDVKDLVDRLLKTKVFAIGGDKDSFGAQDFDRILDLIFEAEIAETFDELIATEKPISEDVKGMIGNPGFWSYAEARKGHFVNTSPDRYRDALGYLSLAELHTNYLTMKVVGAFLMAFDKNGNAAIEAEYGQPSSELKAMLRSFAFLGDLKEILEDSEIRRDETSEITRSQNQLSELLDNDALLGSLVFYADNLAPLSNSDGALNAGEMLFLQDLVESVIGHGQSLSYPASQVGAAYFGQRHLGDPSLTLSPEQASTADRANRDIWLLRGWFNTVACEVSSHGDGAGDVALAWALRFDPAQSKASPEERERLQRQAALVWPFLGTLDRIGYNDPAIAKERAALLYTWTSLLRAVMLDGSTSLARDRATLRTSVEGKSRGEMWNECIPGEHVLRPVTYGDIGKFFATRLNASGFTWLSKRFQLVAIAAPESVTRDMIRNLLWWAPEINAELRALLKTDGKIEQRKVLELLFKIRAGVDDTATVSQDEFYRRAMLATEVLTHLIDLKQKR